jgi:hypothetical protein
MTKFWDILKYHFWIIPVISKLLTLFHVVEYICIPHYLLKLLLCEIMTDFTESACGNPVPSSFFFFSFGCLWNCNLLNAWQYRLTVDIISGSIMKWKMSTLNLYLIKKLFLLSTLYLFIRLLLSNLKHTTTKSFISFWEPQLKHGPKPNQLSYFNKYTSRWQKSFVK